MINLTYEITQKCEIFSPFLTKEIKLSTPFFSLQAGTVAQYVEEIKQTALFLQTQTEEQYVNVYAQRLFDQFSALSAKIKPLQKENTTPIFQSSFQFSSNIHHLSPAKRLAEYRKALRALNEKISWLIEQGYVAKGSQLMAIEQQIQETEYRKTKCIKAIEALEEKLTYK